METPNLDYINQLAREDTAVKETLINVIKTEFPEDSAAYQKSILSKNYKEIQSIVHRIKHKFSILGLEKSYKKANEFEERLLGQELDATQKEEFESTLKVISDYLRTI